MLPRFWIPSGVWTALVVASSPVLIESLDRRGWTGTLPGLSVTGTEVVLMAVIVLLGVAVLWQRCRPRVAG